LPRTATRRRWETTSRNSSSFLDARSVCRIDRPVMLPSGRAKLATKALPTGSEATANTIGMSDVACFAASAGTVPDVTMTLTFNRTNSDAISAKRSGRPSAQRYSIVRLRPSIQPCWPRLCANRDYDRANDIERPLRSRYISGPADARSLSSCRFADCVR
jgi:hypothetical protein